MSGPGTAPKRPVRPDVDWLVVGAGLSGAVLAERIASQLGQTVLVVDSRPHVGGNTFDSLDGSGTLIHRYGAHIFHTSTREVWDYLSRFTGWLPYVHRVLGRVDGRLVQLPFNLNSIDALFPTSVARRYTELLLGRFGDQARVPILTLRQDPEPQLRDLAGYVYDNVFLNYTVKQWGLRPEELDRAVTGRVPLLVTRDDRYFHDQYQGIPEHGYTAMVERILDHPNITVQLSTSHAVATHDIRPGATVWTGPIDQYFANRFGPLPYRSLRFEHSTEPGPRFQSVAVVNYPNEFAFTRILEHAHFSNAQPPRTTITREYPEAYELGRNEAYYPIPTAASRARYLRYSAASEQLAGRVVFAGRLAHYRYYDMDQAVAHALHAFAHRIQDPAAPSALMPAS